jgi:hypothetical protein
LAACDQYCDDNHYLSDGLSHPEHPEPRLLGAASKAGRADHRDEGAENRIATVEDLSEEELEKLHKDLCARAETTSDVLNIRRAKKKQAR